jgi:hypothetical protein
MIHTGDRPPKLLAGEKKLGYAPIRMEIDIQNEKLAKESRINYAALNNIQHNVRVFFIGRIVGGDLHKLEYAVNSAWSKKMTPSKKHSHKGRR